MTLVPPDLLDQPAVTEKEDFQGQKVTEETSDRQDRPDFVDHVDHKD